MMAKSRSCDVCARKRIIERRGKKCEHCGYEGYVEMHHMKPVSKGGNSHAGNDHLLVLLCEYCHAKEHGYKKKKYLDARREHWKPPGETNAL
jgi:5-methylcytosine-specific restriction endonuclease McrA